MIGAIEDDALWHGATCESVLLSTEEREKRGEGERQQGSKEVVGNRESWSNKSSQEDRIAYPTEEEENPFHINLISTSIAAVVRAGRAASFRCRINCRVKI